MKPLRLGTRKSALAQTQARWVADQLLTAFPGLHIELVLITTTGDEGTLIEKPHPPPSVVPPLPSGEGTGVRPGGLKALFTKEIEEALLDGRIDFAVHSLKDMETTLPKGLKLTAVPKREDPRDAWIGKKGVLFNDLKSGARVGTSAARRVALVRHMRSDVEIVPLRGNVDTRLRKLEQDNLDGIVLAVAGLKRLGREDAITEIFSPEKMIPAVGQGALGIETRDDDASLISTIQSLDHPETHQAVLAERAFLQELGGSCKTPIGGYACREGHLLTMRGLIASLSGKKVITDRHEGRPEDAENIGRELAESLLKKGGDELLKERE